MPQHFAGWLGGQLAALTSESHAAHAMRTFCGIHPVDSSSRIPVQIGMQRRNCSHDVVTDSLAAVANTSRRGRLGVELTGNK